MSTYVINSAGSATFTYPSTFVVGDILRFNVTNTDTTTAYTGTMIPYTFPRGCVATIRAYGARGSYGNLYTYGLTESTRSGHGAYAYGQFTFTTGDQLLILVGQHGKDAMTAASSTRDQTTGAGGGATTIAKKVSSSSYLMVGASSNGSNTYAGWYLEPLVIAAGGNGSRDNGYSGTGTIYNGLGFTAGTAERLGYSTYSYYPGGTFSLEVGSTSSNSSSYSYGRSFLQGGLGSMYRYTRTSYALAGFGGGGSSRDDGAGGGGGGWVSGYNSAAAQSYVNTSFASTYGSTGAANAGDGYVEIQIVSLIAETYPKIYSMRAANTLVTSSEQYVYVDDTNKFKRVKEIYAKNSAGVWVKATS